MDTPFRNSTATASIYDAFSNGEEYAFGELSASDRIGPPLARSSRKTLLRSLIAILITAGAGWMLLGDRSSWPAWLKIDVASLSGPKTSQAPAPHEPVASILAPRAPEKAVEEVEDLPEAPPLATVALPPETTPYEAHEAPPLRAPAADPADPYQMRAAAAGLHPELSHALLERLSTTDYRNASAAIMTALAETSDTAEYVWPLQRKPELALFTVHFVAGAAPGCRRYVVTVAKDGWSTTALPMEKCKSLPRPARPQPQVQVRSRDK